MFRAGLILELEGARAFTGGLAGVGTAFKQTGDAAQAMGRSLMGAGAVLLGAAAAPIFAAGQLEDSLAKIRSLSGQSETFVNEARSNALKWQASHLDSSRDYLDTLYNIQSAGVPAAAAIAATEGSLLGARATFGDSAQFAAVLGSAFNNLADDTKPATEELDRFRDLLVGTQQRFQFESLTPLADGFSYASAAAKSARVPVEQMFAVLGRLNSGGVVGARAGTAFTALVGKLNSGARALGYTYTETADGGLDLVATLRSMRDRLGDVDNLTPDVQDKLRQTFGESGYAALIPLLSGVDELAGDLDALANSKGLALRAAATIEGTFLGKLQILKGAATSIFQSIGSGGLPALKGLADGAIGVLSRVLDWTERNQALSAGLVAAVGGMGAALAGVGGGLWVFGALSKGIGEGLQQAAAFGKMLRGFSVASLFSPWGLALAGVAVGVALVVRNWSRLEPVVTAFSQGFMMALGSVRQAFGPLIDIARDAWQSVSTLFTMGQDNMTAGAMGNIMAAGARLGAKVGPAVAAVAGAMRQMWTASEPVRTVLFALGRGAATFAADFASGYVATAWSAARASGGLFDKIGALGSALVHLWTASAPLRNAIFGLVGAFMGGESSGRSFGSMLGGFLMGTLTFTVSAIGWVVDRVADLYDAFNWTARAVGQIGPAVSQMWGSVSSVFASVGPYVLAAVAPVLGVPVLIATHWGRIVPAVAGIWGRVSSTVSGFLGRVRDAILGFDLFAAGQRLMSRFAEGIRSAAGAVTSAVRGAFTGAAASVPQSPVKEGPLVAFNTAGARLMDLFASTVTPAPLRSALASAFGDVQTPALSSSLSVTPSGALASQGRASASQGAPVVSLSVNVTVNAPGGAAGVQAATEAGIARPMPELRRLIIETMAQEGRDHSRRTF